MPDLLEHLPVDAFDVVRQLHVLRVGQPVENLFFVVDVAVVLDGFAFAEVGDAWGVSVAVFLRHETVPHLDDLDPVLCGLVVDELDVAQDPRTVRIFFFV